jgi:phosphoadenosine phosphosulfate reductase
VWCQDCRRETENEKCELCGHVAEQDIPIEIFWCDECKTPIIRLANSIDKNNCSICYGKAKYMCADLRPVFPEERLLLEIISAKPFEYNEKSVWASNNRYYIDGNSIAITKGHYTKNSAEYVSSLLKEHENQNGYTFFNSNISMFIKANRNRLNYLIDEATEFIKESSKDYSQERIVISFSGGKDSTVVSDLAVKALKDASLVHIFGDTTLEFPLTLEYVDRYKTDNPKAIFKTARNDEQNFFKVCEDIGPPARMLRWCCTMFKTGPITRAMNRYYRDCDVLTYYGIRKCESVSRSKYNRVEDSADTIKIRKQKAASPIFLWRDIEIWLYILGEQVDFNDAYRLGYDRVGCWCCPNNNERAQYLSQIYMTEKYTEWREFLIGFAKRIGKPDAKVYIDTGKWKARQGGNGVEAAEDVKIKFTNCTAENNAKIYELNRPYDDDFLGLFIPFGRIAKELGRKIIKETIILDMKTNVPILSVQPFTQDSYEYSVKIKTMNVAKHEDLQRMVSYQIRKHNACRKCLKCESLCKYGAITIINGEYRINNEKCSRCKMCVTYKYLEDGCLMKKFLGTKEGGVSQYVSKK